MKGVRIMGLFSKKKKEKPEEKKQEMKVYIQGAGGSIVSKSILNGTSRLKWLFRQESEHGNGWAAIWNFAPIRQENILWIQEPERRFGSR